MASASPSTTGRASSRRPAAPSPPARSSQAVAASADRWRGTSPAPEPAVGRIHVEDLRPVSVGLQDRRRGEAEPDRGLGRRGQRERGERVGPDEHEQVGGITAGLPGQGRRPGRPPVAEELAVAEAHPQVRPGRLVGIDPGDGQDRHVRVAVEPERHLLAFAECHDDPPAFGGVRGEPAGELVADAIGGDPARVALADDGRGDGQDGHRDQGDRRDARRAGDVAAVLRWRRPATSHAPPAPTATADSTARPAKLRAFSPRLAAYRAAGASPIAATRRRRGPRPGERSARQATTPQPAIAIASRNAVERSTRSATSTSRASMTDSALSGKSWPVEAQTTTHHQAAVRTAAPMKTAASRARRAGGDRPDQRHRQDEQRQGRLLDQDREAEQEATDGPATDRRAPDGEQGRDDRGRLRQVDAERRDEAPDERRRDQRERGPDRPARPGEEPAESQRAGQGRAGSARAPPAARPPAGRRRRASCRSRAPGHRPASAAGRSSRSA